jgi:type IV pilus assembly protein PilM
MRNERRTVGSTATIGLHISSGAVRAAEISRNRRGLALRHVAEIPLAPGVVVDGEVRDPGSVAGALRQLWTAGGFSSRKVVLSVSGPRVIVRQADVVTMSASDFASALQFQAAELIPLPVEHAVLDFTILPPSETVRLDAGKMRILLGAAPRDLIEGQLGVLRDASLQVVGVDVAPMAGVRASVRTTPAAGTLGIVDMSDDLTVISVREGGSLRFSRILTMSGGDLPSRGSERPLSQPSAFGGSGPDTLLGGAPASQAVLDGAPAAYANYRIDSVATKVVGSLSFFASQLDSGQLDEVIVTGHLGLDPKLLAELERRLPSNVRSIDALEGLDLSGIDLDVETRIAASANAFVPVGAALWAFENPGARISLLPREVAVAAALRRQVAVGALVALLVILGLGAATYQEKTRVTAMRQQAAKVAEDDEALSARVRSLAPITAAHAAVTSRLATLRTAEAGDIAWAQLLAEISATMPSGATLTNVSFTSAGAADGTTSASSSSSAASSSTSVPATGALGTVTMSVTASGGEDEVAIWLRALSHVKGISAVWVPSGAASGGTVTFTSTASVTKQAPMVVRNDATGSPS